MKEETDEVSISGEIEGRCSALLGDPSGYGIVASGTVVGNGRVLEGAN